MYLSQTYLGIDTPQYPLHHIRDYFPSLSPHRQIMSAPLVINPLCPYRVTDELQLRPLQFVIECTPFLDELPGITSLVFSAVSQLHAFIIQELIVSKAVGAKHDERSRAEGMTLVLAVRRDVPSTSVRVFTHSIGLAPPNGRDAIVPFRPRHPRLAEEVGQFGERDVGGDRDERRGRDPGEERERQRCGGVEKNQGGDGWCGWVQHGVVVGQVMEFLRDDPAVRVRG